VCSYSEVRLFYAGTGDATPSRSSSQEIDSDEATHAASSAAGQSCAAPVAADSLQAPLRRRRASMQDALDFTKINASLYERPVSYLLHSIASVIFSPSCTNKLDLFLFLS